jgi:hypothetical protein
VIALGWPLSSIPYHAIPFPPFFLSFFFARLSGHDKDDKITTLALSISFFRPPPFAMLNESQAQLLSFISAVIVFVVPFLCCSMVFFVLLLAKNAHLSFFHFSLDP